MCVSNSGNWVSTIGSLSENHQETLLGTSLSKQFARLHYGSLILRRILWIFGRNSTNLAVSIAGEDSSGWMSDWALHCALLMAIFSQPFLH